MYSEILNMDRQGKSEQVLSGFELEKSRRDGK